MMKKEYQKIEANETKKKNGMFSKSFIHKER